MTWPGVETDAGFEVLESRPAFSGRIVGVSINRVRLPNGNEIEHEHIHLPPAVAVVPLLEDETGNVDVVLVRQFRTALSGYIHEIPAGILEPGEDAAECAARELEEETGYRAERVTPLAEVCPLPGTSAHRMHFFVAEGLKAGTQSLEEGECLSVVRRPFAGVVRSLGVKPDVGHVTVVDAKTHLALLHVAVLRGMRAS